MTMLAYDDVWLREPRLMTPFMVPLGRVAPSKAYGSMVLGLVASNGSTSIVGPAYVSRPSGSDFSGGSIPYGNRGPAYVVTGIPAENAFNGLKLNKFSCRAGSYTFLIHLYSGDSDYSEIATTNEGTFLFDSSLPARFVVGQNAADSSDPNAWGAYANAGWRIIDRAFQLSDDTEYVIGVVLDGGSGNITYIVCNVNTSSTVEYSTTGYVNTEIGATSAITLFDRFTASAASVFTPLRLGCWSYFIWSYAMPLGAVRELVCNPYLSVNPV